jgi:hypothetical protein
VLHHVSVAPGPAPVATTAQSSVLH